MFEIVGTLRSTQEKSRVEYLDPPERGAYVDGRLRGDFDAIADVELLLARGEPVDVTATGPQIEPGLDEPGRALATLAAVFESGYEIVGDAPRVRTYAVPRGAVPYSVPGDR